MYYTTAKQASIPLTFNKDVAKTFIGKQLEGSVDKVEYEPYEIVYEESGKVVTLDFRWIFLKPGDTVEEADQEKQHQKEPVLVRL